MCHFKMPGKHQIIFANEIENTACGQNRKNYIQEG